MCLLQPSLPSAAGFSAAAHLGCVQPLCSLPGAAQRKEAAQSDGVLLLDQHFLSLRI